MATVYFPVEYKGLAEKLGPKGVVSPDGKTTFSSYMHLMVFSAFVGKRFGNTELAIEMGGGTNEVGDHVFSNNNYDGVAYLLALHDKKTGDILREKHEVECWKVLERYAAHGMKEIHEWMLDRPTDTTGVDTILAKMKLEAEDIITNDNQFVEPTDIDLML